MGYDLEKLAESVEAMYNKILMAEKVMNLNNTKDSFKEKEKLISQYININKNQAKGKFVNKFISELDLIKNDFKSLYDNFDDKLMLFVVGDGNVGKSTLINALVGDSVAETNFLPTTWKIDVYYPSKKDEAIIKYNDGKTRTLTVNAAKKIVESEENKTKESKKAFNSAKNEYFKTLRTKEERDEMERKLADEYIYKSNIVEVRWPVKNNWILDQCYLVDTPGLNQNLLDSKQLGNIQDYYHKADGVLWLIDGQSVSGASSSSNLKELNSVLSKIGGLRQNIIGVINRIDLVRKNAGQEGERKVIQDAEKHFKNNFTNIIPISAKTAFEGIKNNNSNLLAESNILTLQNDIKNIFISKATEIKNSAKEQGAKTLLNKIDELSKKHQDQIIEYLGIYENKEATLTKNGATYKDTLKKELDSLFNSYLDGVRSRVEVHIDALSEGQGKEFIKSKIYDIDQLTKLNKNFLSSKERELHSHVNLWHKNAIINEYKYINHTLNINPININLRNELNLSALENIQVFSPSQEEDLFSLLGNMWGKLKFWLNKSKIKNQLNSTIATQCDKVKDKLISKFDSTIDLNINKCKNSLDESFSSLFLDYEDIDTYLDNIDYFKDNIFKQEKDITFFDILGQED